LWNFALLSVIFFRARFVLKIFTQVLSYVVCTQVRRHVHKQITERRYREEKPGRFVFGKPVLFTLGLGLTAPYPLGILVWNFYQTFVIVSLEFWLRFEPQTRPTRFAINFLFITARAERKVRLCVKLFGFFLGEYSSVWPEICRVLSQIQWRFLRGISGKNHFERIFQKFCGNQGYQNFLFIIARAERKVRLCVKFFDFFRLWVFIRLTWNMSRFGPNSVETLTWNFKKKLFQEKISEILCKPRLLSSTKTSAI